jgi:hypothetical protein
VRRIRPTLVVLAAALAMAGPAGCGFLGASRVSDTKPDGFVLRGHVTVPLAAGDGRPVGAACAAPTSLPEITAGVPVTVSGPDGTKLAAGTLGPGVVARADAAASCDFPFEIDDVPGGVDSYGIAVATRPPQMFAATALREDQSAVLTVLPPS